MKGRCGSSGLAGGIRHHRGPCLLLVAVARAASAETQARGGITPAAASSSNRPSSNSAVSG
jgi:hypothetical protein